MPRSLVPAALLVAGVILAAGATAEDPFAWLEGDWVRETPRGLATESWKRVSPHTMEGIVTVEADGGSRVTEYMRIETFGDRVFYTAKPLENPAPTPFALVASESSRFVFENPDHDFPQRIVYAPAGDTLVVRIEGTVDGELRGRDFRFERAASPGSSR